MQKINHIYYSLLILGFSGASLTHSATPEAIAAALNFCQEKFNTSDKDECQKLIENQALTNIQETFNHLFTTNFAKPTNPEDEAKLKAGNEEMQILSKHLTALRNDQLTPEMTFQCFAKLLIRTIERCNNQTDASEIPVCICNGLLDDYKMMANTPDAIRISKTPLSIQVTDTIAAYGQAILENEISRLKKDCAQTSQYPFPVDTLEELLEAVKATRAKFATIIPAFKLPNDSINTAQDSAPEENTANTDFVENEEIQD